MLRIILCVVASICLFSITSPIRIKSEQLSLAYSALEVMEAYEAGHFQIISTNSHNFRISPNGEYVFAIGDGLYRLTDGKYYEELDDIEFSNDGQYVAQTGRGIFQLQGERWILNQQTSFTFSDNTMYVGVAEVGVYRLDNMQRIFDTDSSEIRFSPNSALVATLDGVYQLPDGYKILNTSGTLANFSPNNRYAWTRTDGLFDLADGRKLLEINTPFNVSFTPNMMYVVVLGDGVYEVGTGELMFSLDYGELEFVILEYSPCGEHMVINGDGVYQLENGLKLFDTSDVTFSSNCTYIVVGNDGVYRLDNMQKVLDINAWVGHDSKFSDNEAYLAIPGNGIYRTSDWQRIMDNGSFASFSPNSTYVAIDYDGVYSTEDGNKLFSITGIVKEFTEDGEYLIVGFAENSGMYNLHSGKNYAGLQPLDISTGVMTIGNVIIIIDEASENQQLMLGIVNNDSTPIHNHPSSDSNTLIYINKGSRLAIIQQEGAWYQVGFGGEVGWIFRDDVSLENIP